MTERIKVEPNTWDWWAVANDRRNHLILMQHQEGGLPLTAEQNVELEILQGLADLIFDATWDPARWLKGREEVERRE